VATETPARTDRRHRRREQTIEEILEVAVELMSEHGVAGLSLGEVARRVGIRTPSLYVYFDSKNALYDAIFERGWRQLGEAMEQHMLEPGDPAKHLDYAMRLAGTFVRWSVEHPAYAQLMAWRPVPDYDPSPEAYAPAVEALNRGRDAFIALRDAGGLRADADIDEALRNWTVLISGVVTQQLANAPDEPYDQGTYTRGLPQLVAMFLDYYGAAAEPKPKKHKEGKSNASTSR
jgi:AcrR family transcriptional regulator